MFSSSSRFRDIPCPLEAECIAPNCIFKHNPNTVQQPFGPASTEDEVESGPPKKRQKIEHQIPPESPAPLISPKLVKPFTGALLQKNSEAKKDIKPTVTEPTGTTAANKSISPPPFRQHAARKPLPEKAESLNPRMLKAPPAAHATRLLYLSKLHQTLSALNDKLLKEGDDEQKKLQMSSNQLILLALDEEERMARDSPKVYANVIKMSIVEHTKMKLDVWVAKRQKAMIKPAPADAVNPKPKEQALDTGLSTVQEVLMLPYMLAWLDDLEPFGYITRIPSEDVIIEAKAVVVASDHWEKCERCESRFQVFPDRREDGALTSGGTCRHHPLRPRQAQRGSGTTLKVYPCCNEPLGASQGCETLDSHVYKSSDLKRLASVMQFESTPENNNVPANRAVSFDCEMCYTTKGMELLRITAVSWPVAELLLDVLVKPLGTILDLNSRFSGVHPEQFANAPPYKSPADGNSDSLQIVDSPQTARQLLFDLLSPSTPLIGHAIENDLTATRIVHPCIIDTVLLFPLRSGLPFRRSLKAASKELLGRSIQNGGAAGHDSLEDATATGDLVRLKVKQRWAKFRTDGWVAENDMLIPPPGGKVKYQGLEKIGKAIEAHNRRLNITPDIAMELSKEGVDSPGR